jgi:hypothetical protein
MIAFLVIFTIVLIFVVFIESLYNLSLRNEIEELKSKL